ncbi:Pls/PosA family non-ribosomal peptide synthetase [Pseudonocardia oroxyli]|uniref:Carrier domain-containing protein n=1 Tax=Pseudonocardia oroxyli TaxID=366584 RepID=A0A1G7Y303_PSEOR|nr:Pls/PosA family non-ribosomal peptide synthetase [Pseudonocardia oroxyli]SDG90646.1 non-ribosomal peptide synthetase terminal domain of unknown function [Pseudonocardia oroxyli]
MSAVEERTVPFPQVRTRDVEPAAVLDGSGVLLAGLQDPTLRWSPGERLHHVFEATCDRLVAAGEGSRLAVSRRDLAVTYPQLDALANRVARFLRGYGVLPGARVGLLLDDPVWVYAGMLAVLKLHAAYVPLDPGTPADRVSFIAGDAGVELILTVSHLAERTAGAGAQTVALDRERERIESLDPGRLPAGSVGVPADELAYVVYTSGTTGRPKGVPIEQASIVNFVRVAAEVYGVRPDDRMYQGLTPAFDFSVEEIWVAWALGATLVPKPGRNLLGDELAEFLREERVTALCCVPTLLATVTDELPDLRFLLVSGEACPQDIVTRWHRPGRRFLNTYGPTEATVTATWTTVDPSQPVTIGVPLPTYSVVVLAEDSDTVLPPGEVGEIAIGGVCLSPGYLNRPDATAKAFVPDPVGLPDNPSRQIYRTGDLGRITDGLRVEYLGRIDTQVKIRGYRIELTEIESVLLEVLGVGQAVVDTYEPVAGTVELVAYYTVRRGALLDEDMLLATLRDRLPAYMVPAYLERLDLIPMLPSDKADRKNLPAPSGARRTGGTVADYVAPEGPLEETLAAAVATHLGIERVSATADLFVDLGMSSLLVAQLSARLRTDPTLPPIGTKDLYLQPTVRDLAGSLRGVAARGETRERPIHVAPTWQYVLCGAAQAGVLLAGLALAAVLLVLGYTVVAASTGVLDGYLRAAAVALGTVTALTLLPVGVKWAVLGRARPATFPIWGARYLRFWIVRTVLRASPARLFVGSPLYVGYLRMLGARIGRGATVFARLPLVHADLIEIGEHAVVRRDAVLTGHHAESGRIRTGRITLGRGAVVGEAAVLDVDTALGDHAQLGHASSLRAGQVVPAGRRVHGSPAEETDTDFGGVPPRPVTGRRRAGYGLFQLAVLALVSGPAAVAVLYVLLPAVYLWVETAFVPEGRALTFAAPGFALGLLVACTAVVLGAMVLRLLVALLAPLVLHRAVTAGTVYPLYGVHWAGHRALGRLSNSRLFNDLLGDSSYIVGFLRMIGYDLRPVEQTGSNFGLAVKHDSPLHVRVGTGTLVSDGLSVANAEYSASSFVVTPATVGERNFVGNNVVVPSGSRAGDNVLLATKVMVPIDGPPRRNTGLLGSPAFEIPRSSDRDVEVTRAERERALPRKNRSNLATMGAFLLQRILALYGTGLIAAAALTHLAPTLGVYAIAVALSATAVFTALFPIAVERAAMGFRRLRPRFCSIYTPYYWRHERLWKLSRISLLGLFDGTPFKSVLWRLGGVRMGRKVFDDGMTVPEKTLVTIGDHATLNAGVIIQCHSLEDAVFTSDTTVLGAGVTVGPNAFVHYGARLGDRVVVDADSFVMKGSEAAAGSRWRGNPALEVTEEPAAQTVIPRQGGGPPGPEPRPDEDRVVRPLRRPRVARRRLAAAAAILTGLAAVGAVALAAVRTPATAAEGPLLDGAYAALRGLTAPATGAGDWATRLQLTGYAQLTGAFERHADLVSGARELALLAAAVTVLGVIVAARRMPVVLALVAMVFALVAALPAVAAVGAALGPVPLGLAWLAAGAALCSLGPAPQAAPLRRSPTRARGRDDSSFGVRRALPLVLGVVAILVGLVTAAVLAVLPVAVVLGLVAMRRARTSGGSGPAALAARLRSLRPRPAVLAGVVGVTLAGWLAVVTLTVDLRPAAADPGHRALAAWLATATDPSTGVAVPAGTWSNLVRGGIPAERLDPGGPLAVSASTSEQDLARFGPLNVRIADDSATASGPAGAQLATNPRLLTGPEVRETLRTGAVDVRALAVLAGLTRLGPVTVTDLPTVPGETAALPRHVVVLPPVDAGTDSWLRAQRPPFAPTITTTADATTLSWPVPAPAELRR